MTRTVRKAFDLAIAATAAIVILNFAASSIGFDGAEAQDQAPATFQVASFAQ